MFDLQLTGAGFVVGVLVGMTGVGGGALMTPLLILLFGMKPTMAVGTDLVYATITKTFGAVQYARRGQVNFPYVRWLATGSVPGAMLAVFVLSPMLEKSGVDVEFITTTALGAMLALAGILGLLERRFFEGKLRNSAIIRSEAVQRRYKEPLLVVGGFVIGIAVGMTSVGSGAILMAILLLVSELNVLVLIGTDLVHATVLLAAAGLAHGFMGHVEYGVVFPLILGSIPGTWTGGRLAQVVPPEPLRIALGVLLVVTGLKLVAPAFTG